ncbi:hypothetical protein [Clostridium manihotivorum]|uniref:Uncharacterized protein n=1 Tax=Clostridium manihotivorum TaxID=2320868 RepID=A0A3R5X395_9CLOT|nr:hypothetical protein [Clostridium manihotivorum]QAA33372.1 hypothetical protein C1I91_17915 [Clostridium manihotivorum]
MSKKRKVLLFMVLIVVLVAGVYMVLQKKPAKDLGDTNTVVSNKQGEEAKKSDDSDTNSNDESKNVSNIDNLALTTISTKNKVNYLYTNNNLKKQYALKDMDKTSSNTSVLYNSKLYYTYRDGDGLCKLKILDLATKREEEANLSIQLNSIDYIEAVNNNIYMKATKNGKSNSGLVVYSIEDKTCKTFDYDDDDDSLQCFDVNKGKIVEAKCSLKQQKDALKSDNGNAGYTIKIIDEKTSKVVYSYHSDKIITFVGLSDDLNKVLLSVINTEYRTTSIRVLDIKENNEEQLSVKYQDYKLVDGAKYSSDGKGVYFLATNKESKADGNNILYNTTTLYYYDLKDNALREVLHPLDGVISNYSISRENEIKDSDIAKYGLKEFVNVENLSNNITKPVVKDSSGAPATLSDIKAPYTIQDAKRNNDLVFIKDEDKALNQDKLKQFLEMYKSKKQCKVRYVEFIGEQLQAIEDLIYDGEKLYLVNYSIDDQGNGGSYKKEAPEYFKDFGFSDPRYYLVDESGTDSTFFEKR